MFFELIAAFVAGGFAAGAVLIVNKLTGGLLPRWVMPVAAGAGIIAYAIFMEYSWYGRSTANFPDSVVVTETHESSAFWRPWTYAWPITDRLIALDRGSVKTNDAVPDQRMADLVLMGRWQPTQIVPVVYDCAGARTALMLDTVTFDDTGAVTGADWGPVPADDPTMMTVCKEG